MWASRAGFEQARSRIWVHEMNPSASLKFIRAQNEPVVHNPKQGFPSSTLILLAFLISQFQALSSEPRRRLRRVTLLAFPPTPMSDTNNELALDSNDLSEASTGEKRKRDVRLRSKAWEHFTKLVKEDGTYEKCKCNHCNKLFTCSSRSGTTHLLRHITEGICPRYKNGKKDRSQTVSTYMRGSSEPRSSMSTWKFDQVVLDHPAQQKINAHDELLPVGLDDLERETHVVLEDDYVGQAPKRTSAKFPQQPALKRQCREELWMNELDACVYKLVDLINERLPRGKSIKNCSAVSAPDYSINTAIRLLNEMEDVPPSSEMYLDAFELLRDNGERECFVCLPPEARRRWLQRMLHRHYPLRYDCNF